MVGQHRGFSVRQDLAGGPLGASPRGKEPTKVFSSADEVLSYAAEEDVKFIDVRFCDLPGIMQHFTVPVGSFTADTFDEGLMFDGSSVRGFQQIHESDMLLLPDVASAFVDPFRTEKTVALNFFIHDPF